MAKVFLNRHHIRTFEGMLGWLAGFVGFNANQTSDYRM